MSANLYYGDHGYSTCAIWSWSLMKRQKRGGSRRGAFLPNFQKCLFLAYIHIIGTSDVPYV